MMTREEKEEAINFLKGYLDEEVYTEKCRNAHKMTVKALGQEPCDDCISRQAALDCVDERITELKADKEFNIVKEICISGVKKHILSLPSVNPTRPKAKWIVDDKEYNRIWHCHCTNCNKDPQNYIGGSENWWLMRLPNYCPNCGAEMESEEK